MLSKYDTLFAFTNTYDNVETALQDFDAVKALYQEFKLSDTFDAVVVEKRPDGKVKIVKGFEQPTHTGLKIGMGAGLAIGLVLALFPAAALGTRAAATILGATTFSAGALGAIAGHVGGGLNRADLMELGETLDSGSAALVVVSAVDMEAKVQSVLKKAMKTIKKQIKADSKELLVELAQAEKDFSSLAGQR